MMNSVNLVGRLTRDPEYRTYEKQNGEIGSVANFTLAVGRTKSEEADFVPVSVFGAQADAVNKYLKKGSLCSVQGRYNSRSYETESGEKRYSHSVVADDVRFLERRKDAPAASKENAPDREDGLEV
jgi:single-strand DNA-binding protein